MFRALALISAASLAAAPVATYSAEQGDPFPRDIDFFPRQKRGKGKNNRRGKGKRSPPKSRPNRLTISKRVRRKHRRARA